MSSLIASPSESINESHNLQSISECIGKLHHLYLQGLTPVGEWAPGFLPSHVALA